MSADKEESVYCERGEVSRERFQLMNIHQSNDGSGQITIKALQAAREVLLSGPFYYPNTINVAEIAAKRSSVNRAQVRASLWRFGEAGRG